ncbi:MAG: RNA methyltransferase [Clostridia bacterium]|nr:RNA methyltransferase [Clostridia bacterium]
MSRFIIEGFVSVKSAVSAGNREVFRILLEKSRYEAVMGSKLQKDEQRRYASLTSCGVKCEILDKTEYSELVKGENSGGIAAEVGERRFMTEDNLLSVPDGYIAVLDGIEDPFNYAYSIRSLYAAGVNALIVPNRCFENEDALLIRSSAGAYEHINIFRSEDIAQTCIKLKEKGWYIASTAKTEKARDLYRCSLKKPLCLVFGGEKRGIKQEILNISDTVIKLKYPRDCRYSLPACCAVSVISFECAKKIGAC